ncbi:glycosyltransferase family 87 protein [Bradyrhizobium sp. sGM-13]|uniref:glycosyltransferase family 87 protein n=1 Tax=Bradyrhizobium sp. sGM-13 TaxID=2831781 RepID=UPI001BCB390E|nr:glycosyltransferase family 87 protein [Bradyrhizobium sp. sGM-13]
MPDESLSNPDRSCAARFLSALIPQIDNPEDAEFLRGLLLLGSALFTLTLLAYACTTNWTWPFPRDNVTLVLGRDFLNLWMYGHAVLDADPARFYDLVTYNAELAKLLGPGYPGQNWPNPPTALVVMAPFGLLAYFPALIAWFVASFLAFYLAGRREVADARILVVVLVSPAALLCVISGQSSLLTTAALLAIFASLDRRPVVAGVLIGLLTVKPQLGVLFPFALIASGRWRVFLWAAMTTIVLFAISVAIGGPESWHDYIAKALPLQREVLSDPAGTAMPFQASIFMNVRGLVGNRAGEAIQFAFALAAVVTVTIAFRYCGGGDARLLQALFLACTVSTSPYLGSYDLLPLSFASVALLAEGKLDATGRRLAQLVFWTPALQLLFGNLQIPGPGFIAPVFAAYLLQRLFAPAVPGKAAASLPLADSALRS